MTDVKQVPFVQYLEGLRDDENRTALAVLRRGLRRPPGMTAEMHPWVVPWLPQNAQAWQESPYYIVASLFALHPQPGGEGTMGRTLAAVARTMGPDNKSIERRFVALLRSHPAELPERLRHCVALSRSKGVPVNWHRLFLDIQQWGHPRQFVQRAWARDFWSAGEGSRTTGADRGSDSRERIDKEA